MMNNYFLRWLNFKNNTGQRRKEIFIPLILNILLANVENITAILMEQSYLKGKTFSNPNNNQYHYAHHHTANELKIWYNTLCKFWFFEFKTEIIFLDPKKIDWLLALMVPPSRVAFVNHQDAFHYLLQIDSIF